MLINKVASHGVRTMSMRMFSVSSQRCNRLINLAVDDKTGIATMEFNRPPVNSLNTPLLQDISGALDELTRNRSKGLIITSVKRVEPHATTDLTIDVFKPIEKLT